MIYADRITARLKLIAMLNELPLEAEIRVSVSDIARVDFDEFDAETDHGIRGKSYKELTVGPGHKLDLCTDDPPNVRRVITDEHGDVVAYVSEPRRGLRLVKDA